MSDIEKATVNANPIPRSYPNTASTHRPLANPGPLGLFAFAGTTLVLSLYNVSARGVNVPNAVVGMALFYGGLAQLLAGMWEFACANTLGATAFSSYGGFWLSFATLFIPGSGISDSYSAAGVPKDEFSNALGIYLMVWMSITFLFMIASLRRSIAFISLFGFLTLTFLLLGAGEFSGSTSVHKAGGAFGIVTALIAFYIGMAELLGPDDIVMLPLGVFKTRTA